MKKKYIAPEIEFVLLEPNQALMDNEWTFESGIEDPFNTARGYDLPYGNPNGTVVNNNGAPTFVPGGNGGGGRQTPLG